MKKELGLWDVYAISTGAMFSSGFFLLPGLASAHAGPSTVLAYLVAGLMMIPAMLCIAELASALPRAGGTYYFLDRSMGPAVGAIGGLGTWLALVLKSGFALLGMGAYLAIAPGVSDWLPDDQGQRLWIIKGLAVAMTVVFAAVNIFGAKESTKLQGMLVIALLAVLAFFVVQGLWYVGFQMETEEVVDRYTPFFDQREGINGMLATVGLVFVSYAGLTKVASVSEEVKRPHRNLPLGMFLSLGTATVIYVVGVAIMIAVVPGDELKSDYTPVATAAESFFSWLPEPIGLILIIIAALAAFASTGNAGILAASRYPLAMSRDRLIGEPFGRISRFGTPTIAIIATSAMMIFFIVALSAEGVAKLASAFNLLIFAFVGMAVIVMRESKIESYDPGFRSPLYPWMPLAATIASLVLILEMGPLAWLFTLVVTLVGAAWYWWYARGRVVRDGAIYHIFARLGSRRYEALDQEFRQIIKEKGLREQDPFDDVVARASVIDVKDATTFEAVLEQAANQLTGRLSMSTEQIRDQFLLSGREGRAPIANQAALPHFRAPGMEKPEMVLVRCQAGVTLTRKIVQIGNSHVEDSVTVVAVFLLISPLEDAGMHLRILGQLAGQIEQTLFPSNWLGACDEHAIRELLLRDDRFTVVDVQPNTPAGEMAGLSLAEVKFPADTLVALVRRGDHSFTPRGVTRIAVGDRLTFIGEPRGIRAIDDHYNIPPASQAPTQDEKQGETEDKNTNTKQDA